MQARAIDSQTAIEFVKYPAITREQLRLYAEASGDNNPIHLDDEVAKKFGLPGIIAHGMLVAGLMADRAEKFIEEDSQLKDFQIKLFQTRFKAMVHLGDVLSIGGAIKQSSPDEIALDLQVKNQKGEITTIGTAKFVKA